MKQPLTLVSFWETNSRVDLYVQKIPDCVGHGKVKLLLCLFYFLLHKEFDSVWIPLWFSAHKFLFKSEKTGLKLNVRGCRDADALRAHDDKKRRERGRNDTVELSDALWAGDCSFSVNSCGTKPYLSRT